MPDLQARERGVGRTDLAVGVAIERGQMREARGLGVAEHFRDVVDGAVGIQIADQEAVGALDPGGFFGEAVADEVEINPGLLADEIEAVAAEIEHERIAVEGARVPPARRRQMLDEIENFGGRRLAVLDFFLKDCDMGRPWSVASIVLVVLDDRLPAAPAPELDNELASVGLAEAERRHHRGVEQRRRRAEDRAEGAERAADQRGCGREKGPAVFHPILLDAARDLKPGPHDEVFAGRILNEGAVGDVEQVGAGAAIEMTLDAIGREIVCLSISIKAAAPTAEQKVNAVATVDRRDSCF